MKGLNKKFWPLTQNRSIVPSTPLMNHCEGGQLRKKNTLYLEADYDPILQYCLVDEIIFNPIQVTRFA